MHAVDGSKESFIKSLRMVIFRSIGPNGNKNCPDWDTVSFQVQRAERVLFHWQSAFDPKTEAVEFGGDG